MPRSPLLLVALLAAPLLPLLPLPEPARAAEPRCSDATSTVESTRCLLQALEAVDRRLEQAFAGVAREAADVPSDAFLPLWRDNLTDFHRTSTDPMKQVENFSNERRKVCAYAKSMAFQGTGYGIFITSCEIDLTETLLEQFKP